MRIFLLFILMICPSSHIWSQQLHVGSYNIRYQNDEDTKKGNGWERRCAVVCGQLNYEHPDIFGAQEVLSGQLKDMLKHLDGYAYLGCGRDDGKDSGEYAAIFYDPKRLHLLADGHFWLSPTPEKPSKGWDAACIRICTWGKFEDIRTGFTFHFFNLHLDHEGKEARRRSVELVLSRIESLTGGNGAVILCGDFNSTQSDASYQAVAHCGRLLDCYEHSRLRFAENGTFNDYKQDRKISGRIDHIFVSPDFQIERYGILTNTYWTAGKKKNRFDRRLPSDHYPVFVYLNYAN